MNVTNSTEIFFSMTTGSPAADKGLRTAYTYLAVIGAFCGITVILLLLVSCLVVYVKRIKKHRSRNTRTKVVTEKGTQTDHGPHFMPSCVAVEDNNTKIHVHQDTAAIQDDHAGAAAAVYKVPGTNENNSRIDSVIYENPSNTDNTTFYDNVNEIPLDKGNLNTISDDDDDDDDDVMYEVPSPWESHDRVEGNVILDDNKDDVIYEEPSKQP